MALSPPPPPPRQSRQPFITAFISEVFTFLGARDLLICAGVTRLWKEEGNALSLWRNLLLSNVDTAGSAYCGLTLREMQRLALRKEFPVSKNRIKKSFSTVFTTNNDVSADEHVLSKKILYPRSNISNHAPKQSFSAGIQLRMPLTDVSISCISRIVSLEESMKNISTHFERFKEHLYEHLNFITVADQSASTSQFVQFCDDCAKRLKEHEIFEEIIVNSFCRTFPNIGLRGMRTFAHLEMATLSVVGSPTHLEWCKFKNLLPLDASYFDCLDFLHMFRDCHSQRSELNALSEYWREQQLERFLVLHTHVRNIIIRRNSEIFNIGWNEIVQYLSAAKL